MSQILESMASSHVDLARAEFKSRLNKLVLPSLGICSLLMWVAYYSTEGLRV
jgi:hypothetical protein